MRPSVANISGSSPRMRGTLRARGISGDLVRFIPAHAGNTKLFFRDHYSFPVHPRACGEHSFFSRFWLSSGGSSPRMRGTLYHGDHGVNEIRFIPAHAGNTNSTLLRHFHVTVHPRACGEHKPNKRFLYLRGGSSPRMRGTRWLRFRLHADHRFIPAHAGNTPRCRTSRRAVPVHPRACGEHSDAPNRGAPFVGSSPRMRGTLFEKGVHNGVQRFIPAHAGNTAESDRLESEHSVHPRACGEHGSGDFHDRTVRGSSPRMRGTRSASGRLR